MAQEYDPTSVWMSPNHLAAIGITGLLVLAYKLLHRETLRLPPGPRGWPFIGNLVEFSSMAHQSLMKLSQIYGPLMWMKLGPIPTVVISSPTMAREFLKIQDHVFASRPHLIFGEIFLISADDLILAPLGDNFRIHRKICSMEIFSAKQIGKFQDVRQEETCHAVERILAGGQGGKLVKLDSQFAELSFATIIRVLFGKDFKNASAESGESKGQRLAAMAQRTSAIFTEFFPGDLYPWLRWLDWRGLESQLICQRRELLDFLLPIVEEHKVRMKPSDAELMDFVDVLLAVQSSGTKDGIFLSDNKIVALLQDLMLAGIDTSAGQMSWVIVELMRNPEVRVKLQSELDTVVGRSRLVRESDLPCLPYLEAIVKETMRLHPLVPLLLPHESVKATTVAGYDIPAKTRVLVNVYAIGRDPTVWENPMSFDPSRFLNSSIDVRGQHFELIPFGSGRRMCPGMNFAMLAVQLSVAQIIQTCELSLPKGMAPHDVNVEERYAATVTPLHSLSVLVTPRLEPHVYDEAGLNVKKE